MREGSERRPSVREWDNVREVVSTLATPLPPPFFLSVTRKGVKDAVSVSVANKGVICTILGQKARILVSAASKRVRGEKMRVCSENVEKRRHFAKGFAERTS